MRLVCHELQHAADAQIDTLVVPLDNATCYDTAKAAARAKFHCWFQAAQPLLVRLSGSSDTGSGFANAHSSCYEQQQLLSPLVCCDQSSAATWT